jgi:hypothetical protein
LTHSSVVSIYFVLGDAQDELPDQLDLEVQTISDVIEGGTVVEYCPECFPELTSWSPE